MDSTRSRRGAPGGTPGTADPLAVLDAPQGTPLTRRRVVSAVCFILLLGVPAIVLFTGTGPAAVSAAHTITMLVAGAATGVSGVLLVGQTRNILADPGAMGISSSGFLAVAIATTWGGTTEPAVVTFAGIAGAGLGVAVVLGIAHASTGRHHPLSVIVCGGGVAVTVTALAMLVLSFANRAPADVFSPASRSAGLPADTPAALATAFTLPAVVVALALSRKMNYVYLGDDVAARAGINTTRVRVFGMALSAWLAGVAATVAGPVFFAGLLTTSLVRLVAGADNRWLVPLAAGAGGLLLVCSDFIGKAAGDVPASVVISLAGAPLAAWLAVTAKKVRP